MSGKTGFIRAARKTVDGLTQLDVALRVGRSEKTYRRWEETDRVPNPRDRRELEKVFGRRLPWPDERPDRRDLTTARSARSADDDLSGWTARLRQIDEDIEVHRRHADGATMSELRHDFAYAARKVFLLQGAAPGDSLDGLIEFVTEIRFRNIGGGGQAGQSRKGGS